MLDALQLADGHGVCTPVNWTAGEPVLGLPAIDDDTARGCFGGFDAPRPYLRYVAAPGRAA